MSDINDLIRQINVLEQRLDELVEPEVGGVWADWTPTVDQNGAVAVTTTFARYTTINGVVIMQIRLAVTGAGDAGNDIIIAGIPAAIRPTNPASSTHTIGTANIREDGVAHHIGALIAVGANDLRIMADGNASFVGTVPNFALNNGDDLGFMAAYERA